MPQLRPYKPSDAPAFEALNLAWIETYFEVEDEDRAQLGDPQRHILDKGGRILIATCHTVPVGTVALVPTDPAGTVELIKMSTRADMQGRGIGKALMRAAMAEARAMGADRIWLETNTVLAAALHLYRLAGFVELHAGEHVPSPYDRCNCQMVCDLGAAG